MSSTDRQSRLLATEDWKRVYQSFRNADFQSYDFDNLRRTMINYLRQNYPEDFNDYIESSEYLALIDLIAFLGQNLSFRIDLNARENFLETAERRESVLRLARLISYNPTRNKAANGLLKFDSVSTTEGIIDTNGNNLANKTVVWNDRSNPNYFEQFNKILNSALPGENSIGNPSNIANLQNITTEQYTFNALNADVPIYNFEAVVEGISTKFEVTSTIISEDSIIEEPPLPGVSPSFVYRNDGQGAGSSNTGFFMHFRQGTMDSAVFDITNPIPNQTVAIDNSNINNSDLWLYGIDTNGFELDLWTKLDSVEGNNIIYNSLFANNKNVYAVTTRVNDRVNLVFSDGVFGNLPAGKFRLYYRTSDNRNMVINPNTISNVTIEIPYVSKINRQETLTITLGLKTSVTNARPSETDADIKQNAPATYYTQNRLITAEDYNIGPLGIDQDIIKTRTVNRISSGISRYLDLRDPSGKYSATNLYGNDGVLYKEEFTDSFNFSFVTQSDIEGILYSDIEPRIKSPNIRNFYIANFFKQSTIDLQAYWKQVTSTTNASTGYFEKTLDSGEIFSTPSGNNVDNDNIYPVGTYTVNALKNLQAGALCKFEAPTGYHFMGDTIMAGTADHPGSSTYKWVSVQSVDADGTLNTITGQGPITFNDVIPNGSLLVEILPKYALALSADLKTQIIDRAFSYKDFGIRYDQNSAQWKLIKSEDINTTSKFGLQNAGSTLSSNLDSSWIFYFKTNGQQYTVNYRNIRYIFESKDEIKFFYDGNNKVYDPKTNQVQQDKITVLNINTQPDQLNNIAFNNDFVWHISDSYTDSFGYVDNTKIQLKFVDSDSDGIADNLGVFNDIIGNDKYIFQKITKKDNIISQRYFDNSNGTINTEFANDSELGSYVNFDDGQIFYFSDFDLFKVLNKTQNNLSIINDYKAFIGRDNLKFHYVHVSDSNYRIDPATSNILDTFLLVKSYDQAMRAYINGGLSVKPLPPSTDELFRNYGSEIYQIKSISDEVVFHPVKYKMLFGDKANEDLQVTFKIVKNDRIAINNNELKSKIIDLINQFFQIENWDFGDTFYFQELSSYIMNVLSPTLLSIVVVPKRSTQTFGSLFEISAESDEIFISAATVDNIEIVDKLTADNLQASGNVVTTITTSTSEVQSRTVSTTSNTANTSATSTGNSSSSSSVSSPNSGSSNNSNGGGYSY